jgi:hypothetical protein
VVGDGLLNRRRLVAVCVVAAVVETVLVDRFAAPSTLGLATQASAPPPFGVFHDLRWILVYHESWLGFALELVAFVVFRSAMTTVCLHYAWPSDVPPEPLAVTIRRSVLFTVIAGVLLAPWAALMFALAVVSLSWLFFVAVPVVLLLALFVHGGAVTGSWWYRTLSVRSVAWVVLAFVTLSAFGSALTTCPSWARVPLAVVGGIVNAWLWVRVVDSVLHRRRTPRAIPVALLGIAAVLVLVVGGTVTGFAVARNDARRVVESAANTRQWTPATVPGRATPLVVVTGFDTKWGGRASAFVHAPLPQWRFSYRGAADGRPLPYTAADTHRRLPVLVRELRQQVDAYHRLTGRPISIVAESEGALLATAYLAATPRAPVRNLVLLSPLVQPGRVYYPSGGAEGWGAASAAALEGFAWALDGLSPVDVTPDTPFFRSVVDDAPALRGLLGCRLPGVRQLAVLPLDTAVSAPAPQALAVPYTVVPGFHGGMLDDASTASIVMQVVAGRRVEPDDGWSLAEDVLSAGASAWQVPQLSSTVNTTWSRSPDPDDCPAIRAHLRREMG